MWVLVVDLGVLRQLGALGLQDKRSAHTGREACLWGEVPGARANVDMSLLAQDRTEEFDPGSD